MTHFVLDDDFDDPDDEDDLDDAGDDDDDDEDDDEEEIETWQVARPRMPLKFAGPLLDFQP